MLPTSPQIAGRTFVVRHDSPCALNLLFATAVAVLFVLSPSHTRADAIAFADTSRHVAATALYATASQIRLIQEALEERNYGPLPSNGDWDGRTQAAARAFQEAQGLSATGKIDTALLAALGVDGVLKGSRPWGRLRSLLRGAKWSLFGLDAQDRSSGAPIYVAPNHVRQLQRQLLRLGFDVGAINGRWSELTIGAANQFRVSRGMESSGVLDVALLHALGMSYVLTGEQRIRVRDTVANPFKLLDPEAPLQLGPADDQARRPTPRATSLAKLAGAPLCVDSGGHDCPVHVAPAGHA